MKEHKQESQRAGGLGRVSYLLLRAPALPVTGNEEGEGRNHAKTAREQGGSTKD